MIARVDVYFDGWGEHWLWGSMVSTTAVTRRPLIVFEYSEEAKRKGLELSSYTLPLNGPNLRRDFPHHQMGLPGPVYDSLPDGWGMLLMDRLFKHRGLNVARIGPLERLAYIGGNAMGALSFQPVAPELQGAQIDLPIDQLAAAVREVLTGEGEALLQQLIQVGGSPQGARPKAQVYRDPHAGVFTTAALPGFEAWLVKFPAPQEHPEVCAIEMVYAECLRLCGIQTPDTLHFNLPNGMAAFASKRFDRHGDLRVPMQSLAAFTGADYAIPGALDYVNFLRATHLCTNDVREKGLAFERAVFNVAFNNREDHPKNFAYIMQRTGDWKLAPAYDVTFCEGPGGYHQMDVMGEALNIDRTALLGLAKEAEVTPAAANNIIDRFCHVASDFSTLAGNRYPHEITRETLRAIQNRIDENIALLRQSAAALWIVGLAMARLSRWLHRSHSGF